MDMDQKSSSTSSNVPYLVAVVIMTLLALGAVLAVLVLRPGQDNTQLIATIVGFCVPTTTAILAFMKSQETHLAVNSRLDSFMKQHADSARAEGVIAGIDKEQSRQAAIPPAVSPVAPVAAMIAELDPEVRLAGVLKIDPEPPK